MADPVPVAISGITDPEQVRVLLYASGKPVHAPLVGAARAALNVSDFALTLLDDPNVAAFWATIGPTSPADKAFRRGNILGAVSQSGGVPTGALSTGWIQNASGWYKRDADGTQICMVQRTLFLDTNSYQSATLPAAFISADYAASMSFSTASIVGTSAQWFSGVSDFSGFNNSTTVFSFLRQSTSIAASGTGYAVLTGRWF